MEGYINEDRWIDLSGLPRKTYGGKDIIDWQNSVGKCVNFKYGATNGVIQITAYRLGRTQWSNMPMVTIFIDKYMTEPKEVRSEYLTRCKISSFVKNKIIDMAPFLIQYLVDENDAYKYSYCHNGKILMRCPICGHREYKHVNAVYRCGFSCPICSDGVSAPNKIMYNILQQLCVKCIREVNKTDGYEWMQRFSYDFYCRLNNMDLLIEMDGGFHNLQRQKEKDIIKDKLAKDNNFKLIRIDCDYINVDVVDFVKESIVKSELAQLLPIDKVDWQQCRIAAAKNLMLKACELWENDGLGTVQIAERIGVHKATVAEYLKRGHKANLCLSYNTHESYKRGTDHIIKCIAAIKNDEVVCVFRGKQEIEEKSVLRLGVWFRHNCVYEVCNGKAKTHRGFKFKYITREEYEQYKMIENGVVKGDDIR